MEWRPRVYASGLQIRSRSRFCVDVFLTPNRDRQGADGLSGVHMGGGGLPREGSKAGQCDECGAGWQPAGGRQPGRTGSPAQDTLLPHRASLSMEWRPRVYASGLQIRSRARFCVGAFLTPNRDRQGADGLSGVHMGGGGLPREGSKAGQCDECGAGWQPAGGWQPAWPDCQSGAGYDPAPQAAHRPGMGRRLLMRILKRDATLSAPVHSPAPPAPSPPAHPS
jgi:hypothetical protein